MWPHVYVICVCLVFLSVGGLLKQIAIRQEHQTRTNDIHMRPHTAQQYVLNERKSAGGIVTAQSTGEDTLKMAVKKDLNMKGFYTYKQVFNILLVLNVEVIVF